MKKFNNVYTSLINCAGILTLFLFTLFSCTSKKETFTSEQAGIDSLKILSATSHTLNDRQLSQAICGSCHLFPEPELLDKNTWKNGVLPHMALRVGFITLKDNPYKLLSNEEIVRVIQAMVFPGQPIIDSAVWERITKYYISNAPEKTLQQDIKKPVQNNLPGFIPFEVKLPITKPSVVTLIEFDSVSGNLYLGDRRKNLYKLNEDFKIVSTTTTDSPPSDILFAPDHQLNILTMGEMDPNDKLAGKLAAQDLTHPNIYTILDSLPRPVHISIADVNNDGLEDKVVCGFGNYTGKLVWYEKLKNNKHQEHILKTAPGARKTIIHDLNADNRPDIVALMTQGDEGIYAFLNQGAGKFQEVALLRFPPVYGSSDFELVDFNQDGFLDILYTNGDNADFSYSLKKYHGVRIFLNNGKNEFEQAWFYPLHGATKALVRDFDKDGDPDIAAIAYFPDYANAPEEGFVYFENIGPFKFETYTFNNANRGRWLTLDVGDFDQDHDLDIALGSFVFSAIQAPELYQKQWVKDGPEMIILLNQKNKLPQ